MKKQGEVKYAKIKKWFFLCLKIFIFDVEAQVTEFF